jgi:very-short-patch-repair endonuclease
VWPEARLIVEDDSRRHHSDWRSVRADKRQDRILTAHGWTVIRVTWDDLYPDPAELLADLRRLLGLDGARPLHSTAAPA